MKKILIQSTTHYIVLYFLYIYIHLFIFYLTGEGFEPSLKGYEPFVLPLHYPAKIFGKIIQKSEKLTINFKKFVDSTNWTYILGFTNQYFTIKLCQRIKKNIIRVKGFEPLTFGSQDQHSTAELHPA